MSPSPDSPAPDDDPAGSPPESASAAPKQKRRCEGIQIDGFKIRVEDLRPVEIGEPTPRTWAEVRVAVHDKLKKLAVDAVGLVGDSFVAARRLIRGLAEIPGATARRIDRAHDRADRTEARSQERHQSKQIRVPSSSETADRLETLLNELHAEGISVGVGEMADGTEAIFIVRPELESAAAEIVKPGLPSPEAIVTLGAPGAFQAAQSIEVLGLSPRLLKILEGIRVLTIGDLTAISATDLEAVDGIGPKSMAAIRRGLARCRMNLKDE